MSWDSNNNANGGDGGWGSGAASSGGQWDGGNTPWDGGSTPWGGASDAQNTQDNQFASGNFGGGDTAPSNDYGNTDYNAGGDYGDSYGAGGDSYDSKPKREPRPGDWDCPECGVNNFASRDACFKCSTPCPEGMGRPKRTPRPGDWDCPSCGVNNFASRPECFKCGETRPEGAGPPPREARPGDWNCPECNISNFATRTACFKCSAARPEGMGLPPPADRPDRAYNWASNRARYEYNENALGEDGMAPRDEKLEAELFGLDPTEQHTPLDFSKYANIPINVERGEAPTPVKEFADADLHPVMKENVKLARYSQPTPVQTMSIPIITAGKDLMACAQTGSGKTAAFLIPTLSGLFGRAKELAQPRPAPFEYRSFRAEPLIIIIAPTRELCSQIFDECRKFTYRSMLRPCAVYGGADTGSQLRQLERGCDILAASPGRLMDFIERGKISLNRVKYLVLDEADRMLDMGFEAVIRAIVEKRGLNPERQTLMYSATFPRAIRKLARDFLRPDYLFLKVGRVGGTTSSITQKMVYVEEESKREELRALLNSQPPSRTLIFVETKRSADSLDQYLYERGFPSTSIHGDRTQMEREDALIAFKHGRCPILVATAVAARGIDIRNVMHVINYDMPESMDEYIHRIGRTARVGRSGLATSFYNDRSSLLAPELAKLLKECKQDIPEFLKLYVPENITWEEDLPEEDVPAPSYAGQEYVPMERPGFGAPPGAGSDADAAFNNAPREGDWSCPSCNINNYARRTECFKCGTANPNPSSGGGSGARERRDGDWDCTSCSAVNFARRTDCFKCGAQREGGGDDYGYSGSGDYGAANSGADAGTAGWDANAGSSGAGGWDPNAASAGWSGSAEPAAATGAPSGGWGEPAAAAAAAPAAPAEPAAASGGWGAASAEPAAPAAPSSGWGEPAAAAAAPAAPAAASSGWGEPAAAAAAAAPAAPAAASSGWGEPAAAAPAPAAASSGWGPAPADAAPAAPSGGWGEQPAAPAPKAPSPAPAAASSGGWGEPTVSKESSPAPTANANGWGAPAPAQAPPAAATPPPEPASAPAPAADGWGEPPAQVSGSGWGDAPSKASGGW